MKLLTDQVKHATPFPLQLALLGVSALTAFGFGFLSHTAVEAGQLLQRFGYFAMLGTFFWWVYALSSMTSWKTIKRTVSSWRDVPFEHRLAAALIFAFTLIAWMTMPYSYKVLYDEMVLQSTAWSLHFFREFGTMVRGYEVEGVFRSLFVYVDKRPFFYPFLVSLVHDLSGFRVFNAYVLNTALMPVCLFLFYRILGLLTGWSGALVGLICFGASSLLAQNANGSGMEMLNLAMLLLTILLAMHYLDEPGPMRLTALVLTIVLLAQTRYESALYVFPVCLVILEGWRRSGQMIVPPAILAAPLLLIPCALHNIYLAGTPMLWELHENMTSRFDVKFVLENLKHAIVYFFDFSGRLLSSWWLSVAGFPALFFASIVVLRRVRVWKTASGANLVMTIMGMTVIINLCILMFYYWGQLDDAIVSRLILPFNAVLAAAIAWSVFKLPVGWQQSASRWVMAAAIIFYVGFGFTAIAYNRTLNQQASEIEWEGCWVESRPPRSRFVITNKSAIDWLLRKIPSVAIGRARQVKEQIKFHLEAGTFQEVLVSQYYRPLGPEGRFVLDPQDALPSSFILEPLIERQFGGKLLRISQVTDIRPQSDTAAISPKQLPVESTGLQ